MLTMFTEIFSFLCLYLVLGYVQGKELQVNMSKINNAKTAKYKYVFYFLQKVLT